MSHVWRALPTEAIDARSLYVCAGCGTDGLNAVPTGESAQVNAVLTGKLSVKPPNASRKLGAH
jgi:hypothetical protein